MSERQGKDRIDNKQGDGSGNLFRLRTWCALRSFAENKRPNKTLVKIENKFHRFSFLLVRCFRGPTKGMWPKLVKKQDRERLPRCLITSLGSSPHCPGHHQNKPEVVEEKNVDIFVVIKRKYFNLYFTFSLSNGQSNLPEGQIVGEGSASGCEFTSYLVSSIYSRPPEECAQVVEGTDWARFPV